MDLVFHGGITLHWSYEVKLHLTTNIKTEKQTALLLVMVLTCLTGNSIREDWEGRGPFGPRSILNHLYCFPLRGRYDCDGHIFMVIKVNDCCVPHLPRLHQYQFSTMKLLPSVRNAWQTQFKRLSRPLEGPDVGCVCIWYIRVVCMCLNMSMKPYSSMSLLVNNIGSFLQLGEGERKLMISRLSSPKVLSISFYPLTLWMTDSDILSVSSIYLHSFFI